MSIDVGSESFLSEIEGKLKELARTSELDRAHRDDLYQDMVVAAWAALPERGGGASEVEKALAAADEARRAHVSRARAERRTEFLRASPLRAATESNPEDDIIRREGTAELARRCSDTDFELLMLSVSGLSLSEIQRATGLPRSTVQQRLERTVRVLAKAGKDAARAVTARGAKRYMRKLS